MHVCEVCVLCAVCACVLARSVRVCMIELVIECVCVCIYTYICVCICLGGQDTEPEVPAASGPEDAWMGSAGFVIHESSVSASAGQN